MILHRFFFDLPREHSCSFDVSRSPSLYYISLSAPGTFVSIDAKLLPVLEKSWGSRGERAAHLNRREVNGTTNTDGGEETNDSNSNKFKHENNIRQDSGTSTRITYTTYIVIRLCLLACSSQFVHSMFFMFSVFCVRCTHTWHNTLVYDDLREKCYPVVYHMS